MHDHSHHEDLIKNVSKLSVIFAIIIMIVKTTGWVLTGSLSIFASLLDSCLDLIASIVNLLAVSYALQPPDQEHRFGHGKAEDLAVFIQSTIFGLSGLGVLILSLKKIYYPEAIENTEFGIFSMIISTALILILTFYQRYVISKTSSSIVEADNLHYLSDLFTNIGSGLALVLYKYFNFKYADQIFALIIAFYIVYGSYKLMSKALKNLLDHELSDEQKSDIISIIKNNKDVLGFHDMKTRKAGMRIFIQAHLELDGDISLTKGHEIVENVEDKIKEKFPNAEIIMHQDPAGHKENVSFRDGQ